MVTQQGAEQIMRNVAKRMMFGEAAQALLSWKYKVLEHLNQLRGEAIMRRVGGRWRNREVSDAFRSWNEKWFADKCQGRAESIMRRVGGRWRNREMAMARDEMKRNFKKGIIEMWKNRSDKLQANTPPIPLQHSDAERCGIAGGVAEVAGAEEPS